MRRKTKRATAGLMLFLSLTMLSAAALAFPLSAGAEGDGAQPLQYVDDAALSNTVWEVEQGTVTEGEYVGERSLVFTGGDTSHGLGTTFATVSTLQEFKEFDLYLDVTCYEEFGNSAGSGLRLSFGNVEMNLPSANNNNSYMPTATNGAPALWNRETGTEYLPSQPVNTEYFWVWGSNTDGTRVLHMKLSVRDEGIYFYEDFDGNQYNSPYKDAMNTYNYDKQDGDDYTAEYGKISIGIDVYTTKTLALSRMEVVPYEEDAVGEKVEYRDPAFAAVPDGKKDYKTDGAAESELFTATDAAMTADCGVSLVNGETYGYLESVNEYKNFDLILDINQNYNAEGVCNDFMVDFGNGMTFRVYTSTTEATEVLQRNGANVINSNAQNRYYVATAHAGGGPTGSHIVRLRVQNGTLTYFDGDNGTTVHAPALGEELNAPELKGVIVNHADLFDAGKIKIYPQQNGAPLILNSAEIVNLDKDPAVTGDVLKAMNVSANGNIGVRFYYTFTEELLNDADAYLSVTVGETVEKMPLSSAASDEQGRYVFEVEVAAAQMTEKIKLQIVDGEGNTGKLREYSVKDYADFMLAADGDEAQKELIRAMLNYGGHAQVYFDVNADDLANAGVYEEDPVSGVTEVAAKDVIEGSATGFSMNTYNLYLRSAAAMKFFFTLEEGNDVSDYEFSMSYTDGTEKTFALSPVATENGYYVEIANIPAAFLDTEFTVSVKNTKDDTVYTVKTSPLCYVSKVLEGEETSETMKNLVKALYLYNQKANEFFNK